VHLDPESHAAAAFDDPLVVIDPTDPERNVAAVVAERNVARLIHAARRFLAAPDTEFFYPPARDPLTEAGVRAAIRARDTTPLAVRFDPPDIVDDQLYPQLRRSVRGLVRGLETEDFEVLRSAAWAGASAVLFVELAVAELPAVERHEGPPVHVRSHADRFYETYAEADVYGPFIEGDRYVVERDREVTTARQFVEEELLSVALGAHIETQLEETGYEVLVGEDVASLAPDFGAELARYFAPGL
jgi:tRNA nucleotidyltransferase (CCA-adding enzyme)